MNNPDILVKLAQDDSISLKEFSLFCEGLERYVRHFPFIRELEVLWGTKSCSGASCGVSEENLNKYRRWKHETDI